MLSRGHGDQHGTEFGAETHQLAPPLRRDDGGEGDRDSHRSDTRVANAGAGMKFGYFDDPAEAYAAYVKGIEELCGLSLAEICPRLIRGA
jgi:hypothetical protein